MEAHKATITPHKHRATPTRPTPGTAQLTYYIAEGVLVGIIGGQTIHIEAWSGGAGGSKALPVSKKNPKGVKAAPHTDDANNPYSTGVVAQGTVRGGPLPTGSYSVGIPKPHGHFKLAAELYGHKFKVRTGGFFIHGQGPMGSDGCIVIPDDDFQKLMEALKKSGGGHLMVLDTMDGGFG